MDKKQIKKLGEARKKKTANYQKKYVKKNRKKIREYKLQWMRRWREKHPVEARIQNRKQAPKPYSKYTKKDKEKLTLAVKNWREKNPEKVAAHRKVFVAKRNGTLKQEACFCGSTNTQAHHDDYSKPFQVRWLCKKHHASADLINKIK